ncbi:MAG: transglycosylase SLT domain-containing protein, partial [Gemmatimonadetes bacterium]|nr:transglycosylase SLT domain-containing protein [Gemmatimonadota bacterium]
MAEEDLIREIGLAAAAYGVDPTVFMAQMRYESGLDPRAQGAAGEIGIGQFMPDTWRMVIRQHPELVEKFDISEHPVNRANGPANIWAAAAHMHDLLRQFDGDYAVALAGYNGGAGGTHLPAAQQYAATVLGRAGVTHENQFPPPPGGWGDEDGSPFATEEQRASETWVRLLASRIREEEAKGNHRRAIELQTLLDAFNRAATAAQDGRQ